MCERTVAGQHLEEGYCLYSIKCFISVSLYNEIEANEKFLQEQISIIKEAETKVKSASKVRDKWSSVLRKNPGFLILSSVCDVMNGEDVDLPEQINIINKYSYI